MAPEQILNSHVVDPRTDVYGLGCTLYYLLAGFVPFAGDTLAERLLMHQTAEALPLIRVRRDVPRELSNVVSRMMAKQPHDRYPSMDEVRQALAPWCVSPERLECVGK
jgi:serine/threonine-protein kinase